MIKGLLWAIDALMARAEYRWGEKRNLHGMPVSYFALADGADFEKLEAALALIGKFAPSKLRMMQEDVASIVVGARPGAAGCYLPKIRMVELSHRFVSRPDTTSEAIACVLIHEAQHARLYRLGFEYDEKSKTRIERLCIRAERNFARLLPNAEYLVEHFERLLAADLKNEFSKRAISQRVLNDLTAAGYPKWFVGTVGFFHRLPRIHLAD